MEPLEEIFQESLARKAERRKMLAALPFEEKIRIVVQMQQMFAPILQARGIQVKPWELDEPSDSPP
jgi:hypothetical protein